MHTNVFFYASNSTLKERLHRFFPQSSWFPLVEGQYLFDGCRYFYMQESFCIFCFTKYRQKRVDKVWSKCFAVDDNCQILFTARVQTFSASALPWVFPRFFFTNKNEIVCWKSTLLHSIQLLLLRILSHRLLIYCTNTCVCFEGHKP